MFVTREDAVAEALRIQTARQCAEGRHIHTCPHRVASPWVKRALDNRLPVTETTGNIRIAR